MSDIDNILDETLDDLADLPSNAPFVPGVHIATMSLSAPKPKPGKKQSVMANFVYKSLVESSDPSIDEDKLTKPGDKNAVFISLFKRDGTRNEFGEGQLKQLLYPLKAAGAEGSTRDLILMTKDGIDVQIVTGIRDFNGTPQMTIVSIEAAE